MDIVSYLMGHKAGKTVGESEAVLIKKSITPDSSSKITISAATGEDLTQYNFVEIALKPKNSSSEIDISDYRLADLVISARYAITESGFAQVDSLLRNAAQIAVTNMYQTANPVISASKIELTTQSTFAAGANDRYYVALMHVDSPLTKLG